MKLHKPNNNTRPMIYTNDTQDKYNEVCRACCERLPWETKKDAYKHMIAASEHMVMTPDTRNSFEWLLFDRYFIED